MFKLLSALLAHWPVPWRRPTIRLQHLNFVLYTRHGCHLCGAAWLLLQQAQKSYYFRTVVVDVDSNPQLATRYGNEVPVVTVNGKVRFRGAVSEVLLTRLLRAEADRLAAVNTRLGR